MFSSIFVDRPRLAIVIALVTAIAGLLSLLAIPVAQFPDIVPPQVSVTASLSGRVVRSCRYHCRAGDRIQVVGVDKMIYMKSISGNDGSYSLLVSFELGTNPDINTVNVNNRVQVALSKMPEEVRRSGVTCQEEIVCATRRDRRLFAEGDPRRIISVQLRHHQSARSDQEHARRRRCHIVRSAGLFHAGVDQDRSVHRARPDDQRHHFGYSVAECAGGGRADRRASDFRRPAAAAEYPDQRAADSVEEFQKIIIRSNPDGSVLRLGEIARLELGAANLDRATRLNGVPASLIGIYQSPGANALTSIEALKKLMTDSAKRFRTGGLEDYLRSDDIRHRYDRKGQAHTGGSGRPGASGGFYLPRKHSRHADSDDRRAGQPDRDLHRSQRDRLLRQYGFAARHDPGDRHRGRRRHRGGRGGRTDDGETSRAIAG